jgi:hypothetical protein
MLWQRNLILRAQKSFLASMISGDFAWEIIVYCTGLKVADWWYLYSRSAVAETYIARKSAPNAI